MSVCVCLCTDSSVSPAERLRREIAWSWDVHILNFKINYQPLLPNMIYWFMLLVGYASICFLAPTATWDYNQSLKFLPVWKIKSTSPCCFHFYFPNCEVECFFICLLTFLCLFVFLFHEFSRAVVLTPCYIHQNHSEGSVSVSLGWGPRSGSSKMCQVMLMLLVWGPDFKITKLGKTPGPWTSLRGSNKEKRKTSLGGVIRKTAKDSEGKPRCC